MEIFPFKSDTESDNFKNTSSITEYSIKQKDSMLLHNCNINLRNGRQINISSARHVVITFIRHLLSFVIHTYLTH